MVNNILKTQWIELCSNYTSDSHTIYRIYDEIVEEHSAKGRHYHTLEHISAMLTLVSEFSERVSNYNSLRFAIWYHDIVYNPFKKDNEALSAEKAKDHAGLLRLPEEMKHAIVSLILCTAGHTLVKEEDDFDTRLMVDSDLAILGAHRDEYEGYAKKIRKEYQLIPGFIYKKKRKALLEQFIEIPVLYKTTELRARFEERARENITHELEILSL
ncbi:MAG: hypothetical protein GY754_35100 [bacterium]|nr:hypothetical protein [bacterium]